MAAVAYRYAVRGAVPAAVMDEIRRAHILREQITRLYMEADRRIAELHAAQPGVAEAQDAARQAAGEAGHLREQIQARKAAGRTRRPDPELASRLAVAREAASEARAALKAVKDAARRGLAGQEKAIRAAAYAGIRDLYAQAVSGQLYRDSPVPGALYWATFNMVAAQQRTALGQVIKRREEGQPAGLDIRRWDGTGTIAVNVRREAGAPPRTPAILADTERGPWRNVLRLLPARSAAEWAALPAAERKRAEVRFRVGAGDNATMEILPIVAHRPLPDDAEVTMMQVTVARVTSTRVKASVAFSVRLPEPGPAASGCLAAVHTGWRVLDDGAIRVAVITGAPAPPPGLGMIKDAGSARARQKARSAGIRSGIPGRPWAGSPAGEQESGLRDHGTWQEIVIPARVRDLDRHVRSLRSLRFRGIEPARAAIAAHLASYPASRELIDPDGTLDQWRSPRQFAWAMEVLETAGPAPGQAALLAELRAWHAQEQHLETWQAYERRRHITGWRRDLYRQVAAWLAGAASVIVLDSWSAVRTRPAADEEDTSRMAAGRANAALAAPGDLRHAVTAAAGLRGVAVRSAPRGVSGLHYGCPAGRGELPADDRARHLIVTCRACGRQVDQDRNVLAGMMAAG